MCSFMGHGQESALSATISSLVSRRLNGNIGFIGPTLPYGESLFYSVESQQCLSGGMKGMSNPAYGITTVVAPTVFDIVLLVLTIVKIFKSAALEKHNGSPVVCVTFDCCFLRS
jgi:hypothetical protein